MEVDPTLLPECTLAEKRKISLHLANRNEFNYTYVSINFNAETSKPALTCNKRN